MRMFKNFPCTVYVLGDNFRVKEVKVTHGTSYRGVMSTGSVIWPSQCHATRKSALASGERLIKNWGKGIEELQKKIDKYSAVLKQESGEVARPRKPVKPAPKPVMKARKK